MRSRWAWLLAVILVLGTAVVAFRLLDPDTTKAVLPDAAPSDSSGLPPTDRESAAVVLLGQLEDALADRRPRAATALAAADVGTSRAELTDLVANARALRIESLALRYIDRSSVALTDAERQRFGPEAWVVDVQLTWQFAGRDEVTSSVEAPVVLAWNGEQAAFVTSRLDSGERVPLWFLDRVAVRRTPRALVVATSSAAGVEIRQLARTAIDTVNATLPQWRGTLVVEAPGTKAQFTSASGLVGAAASSIAAVTTTTDGSRDPRAPVHVYVNPTIFDPLGPGGQQIVLSHEATHVAVEAVQTPMPQWLSEGFADFVALADTKLERSVLASQILAKVGKEGAPQKLPGPAEFDGSDEDIGAWYESAWLANVLIADRHGVPALLRFYRSADREGDTQAAFRSVLGTTEKIFVRQWQSYLEDLAKQ